MAVRSILQRSYALWNQKLINQEDWYNVNFHKGIIYTHKQTGEIELKLLIDQHFSVLGRGVIVLTAEDHHKALFTKFDWIFNLLKFQSVNQKPP